MDLLYFQSRLSVLPADGDTVCFVSRDISTHLHLWGEQHMKREFVLQQCHSRIHLGSIDMGVDPITTSHGGFELEPIGFVCAMQSSEVDDQAPVKLDSDQTNNLNKLLHALYEMTPANRTLKVDSRLIELILNRPAFEADEWIKCYQGINPTDDELFDWLCVTTKEFGMQNKEFSTAFKEIHGQKRFDQFFEVLVNIRFALIRLEEAEA